MIEKTDISFVLSGGTTNSLAIDSLGGDPSVTSVPTRLFSDLSPTETSEGSTDYRCIYIANDNETDTLYHTVIFAGDQIDDGASVELGFRFQNEIQQLSVATGTSVTSGSFILTYDEEVFTVNYNATLSTWESNFQTAIRAVADELADVTVSVTTSGSQVIFQIEFSGIAGNRYHPLLEVDTNSLSPASTISIQKIAEGGPINTVAPEIDHPKTAPTDIEFYSSSEDETLELGQLRPTDMVPVWIKRICPANTEAMEDDGFTLKLQGNPID